MASSVSRRQWLAGAAIAAGAAASPPAAAAERTKPMFRYSLNTSTIRGQKLSVIDEVEIAAKAGYHAIEPWTRELQQFVDGGGSLKDLGKRIRDHGMTVESAIGFAEWIVDDDVRRKKGLEQARRDMDMVLQIGGSRLAAPPFGATDRSDIPLMRIAERYRTLLTLGDQSGVVPQVEMWGFSKTLSRLSEVAMVAVETGHPKACVLPDVYHFYKGGSSFGGLKLMGSAAISVFHMNDYPADPPPAKITDAQRVYPGDGVAPLTQILSDLHRIGFQGVLSLELFNPEYWKQDATLVAKTGLEKMKSVVEKALATIEK
jgi:sugar phosphate isomerase/epimerase